MSATLPVPPARSSLWKRIDALDPARLRARGGGKWNRYPADVLPAWVADMDYPVAEPVHAWLTEVVEQHAFGYPLKSDDDPLPEVFAARMRDRHGWTVAPGSVELLTDVVQGLFVSMEMFAEAGEGAVIQTPIYPPFLHSASQTGRRAVFNPLVSTDAGYEIDFDHLEGVIDGGTRLLMLCHPHNPTGRAFTRTELERLADVALRHDLTVLSDEIHADLVLDGRPHVPFASLAPEVAARTVTFASATKAFNLAGLRCALAVFGTPELQARFNRISRRVRGGLNCLATTVTRIAWEEGGPWHDSVLAYLTANRDRVAEFVRDRLPEVGHRPPQATYLAWLDCRALGLEPTAFDHFLREGRVALMDGALFGEPGVGHVRLNFATSRPILDQILERMASALGR